MDASTNDVANFHLSKVNAEFVSRSNDIFSCLDSIEAKHNAFEKNQCSTQSSFLKPDPIEEPISCKSTFKMPKAIPKRCRIPDYKLRPEKWKMYDLSDVSVDQLSDSSNRKIAEAFISGLKKKCDHQDSDLIGDIEEDMTICTDAEIGHPSFASNKQHLFKKPFKQTQEIKESSSVEPKSKVNEACSVPVSQPNDDQDVEETNQEKKCSHVSNSTDNINFHGRSLKGRKASIRSKSSTYDDDDDDDEQPDLDIQKPQTAEVQDSQETDKDEFSDHTAENSDEDEDNSSEFGLAWSKSNKTNSEDHSDDEDVLKRAEEFAVLDRSSCLILGQSSNCETNCTNGDSESLDDLDNVD